MATRKQIKTEESKAEQPAIKQGPPEEEVGEILSAELRQETDALLNVAEKLERTTGSFAKQQQEFHSVRSMQQEMQGVLTRIIEGIEKASVASAMENSRPLGSGLTGFTGADLARICAEYMGTQKPSKTLLVADHFRRLKGD